MIRRLPLAFIFFLLSAAAAGAAEPPMAKLHWSAIDGQQCYGYMIYRATDRQGPFLRINRELVPTPADGAREHQYEYLDRDVVPGATYYYYLDFVDKSGIKHRFSGVLSKTVAAPTATPTAAPTAAPAPDP